MTNPAPLRRTRMTSDGAFAVACKFGDRLERTPGNENGAYTKALLLVAFAQPGGDQAGFALAAVLGAPEEWTEQVWEQAQREKLAFLAKYPTPEAIAGARADIEAAHRRARLTAVPDVRSAS